MTSTLTIYLLIGLFFAGTWRIQFREMTFWFLAICVVWPLLVIGWVSQWMGERGHM